MFVWTFHSHFLFLVLGAFLCKPLFCEQPFFPFLPGKQTLPDPTLPYPKLKGLTPAWPSVLFFRARVVVFAVALFLSSTHYAVPYLTWDSRLS